MLSEISDDKTPHITDNKLASSTPAMTLPILAKKVKKLATFQLYNLKMLLNGESSEFLSEYTVFSGPNDHFPFEKGFSLPQYSYYKIKKFPILSSFERIFILHAVCTLCLK